MVRHIFFITFILWFFGFFAQAAYINQVQITDNVNTAAVKAPSTAPLASDPALVVSLSPNASLPLPSGGATSAKQDISNGYLLSIDGKLTSPLSVAQSGTWDINNILGTITLPTGAATSANQATANASLSSIDSKIVAVNTGAVVVSSSALPAGASTSALQTTGNTSLDNIDLELTSGIGTFVDKTATASLVALNDAATINANGVGTVGLQITGTWVGTLVFEGTNDLSNFFSIQCFPRSSTGASVTSTSGNTQLMCPAGGLAQMRIRRSVATSGTAVVTITGSAANSVNQIYQLNANNNLVAAAQTGTWNITNVSGTVSLPTGAATSANQTTANASLSSIDGKTPALGQATMANSSPVVIASNQSAIPVTQSTSPWITQQTTWTNQYLNGAATTTVKSGSGVLRSICYTSRADGSTLIAYDNTAGSGTILTSLAPANGTGILCADFGGVTFSTGLTIVTTGTANWQLSYR